MVKISFVKEFEEQVKRLEISPYMYQKVNKESHLEIRRIKIKKYILFYNVIGNKVFIHRILPEKFDYLNHLKKYKILISK